MTRFATTGVMAAALAFAFISRIDAKGAELGVPAKLRESQESDRVVQRLKEWTEAIVHGDFAALDRIEADDFTLTSFQGKLFTKAEDIADLESGDWKIDSLEIDDVKVRLFGLVAVVTSRATRKGALNKRDVSGQFRWIDVLVQRQGQWQLLVHQGTRISP